MRGFIPIEIPTKRYIKAYMQAQLGERPLMTTETHIGNKLFDLLRNKRNERRTEFANKRYNARMRIYVSYHTFKQRGANLHETNIKNFNLFIEREIKEKFYFLMDTYIDMLPSFEANLPQVRKKLGICVEDWDCDSMRKDYYRYRLANGKALLYDKNATRTVPSFSYADASF